MYVPTCRSTVGEVEQRMSLPVLQANLQDVVQDDRDVCDIATKAFDDELQNGW